MLLTSWKARHASAVDDVPETRVLILQPLPAVDCSEIVVPADAAAVAATAHRRGVAHWTAALRCRWNFGRRLAGTSRRTQSRALRRRLPAEQTSSCEGAGTAGTRRLRRRFPAPSS